MTTTPISSFPTTGFVRIRQILQLIPVSASTWWAGVASGKYPPAIKLGARTTVWKAEDIHTLIAELAEGSRNQNSHTRRGAR